MLGRIYKITNLINNKVYIGQTINTLQERWWGHCQNVNSNSYKMVIKRAIKKYGKESFKIELLEECDQKLLNEKERFWINYYNSFKEGYNSTIGGQDYTKMPKLLDNVLEIINLYNDGFSLRTIAKDYNVDHATIKLLLTRNNIPLRQTRSYKLSEKERQEIVSKVKNGIIRKEIMKEYHISKSYLSQLINGKRRI